MPSCFVEEQLTQRRERRVGHVSQSEHGGLSRAGGDGVDLGFETAARKPRLKPRGEGALGGGRGVSAQRCGTLGCRGLGAQLGAHGLDGLLDLAGGRICRQSSRP
jgi:hypothetical protein